MCITTWLQERLDEDQPDVSPMSELIQELNFCAPTDPAEATGYYLRKSAELTDDLAAGEMLESDYRECMNRLSAWRDSLNNSTVVLSQEEAAWTKS